MEIKDYPHSILLAKHPELRAKLGAPVLRLIQTFEAQWKYTDGHFVILGTGKGRETLTKKRADAFARLVPGSEDIAEFIQEFIQGEAPTAQATPTAVAEIKDIAVELNEAKEEIEDLFEDLEEYILQKGTVTEEHPTVGIFSYTDTQQVINKVANPNYGKKFRVTPDGSKEYLN